MLNLIKRMIAPVAPPGGPAFAGKAPDVPGTTRPYVLWADQYDPPVRGRLCPNCGGAAPKPPVLTIRYTTPEHPMRFARLLHCSECTCHFYERQKLPDYAESGMLDRGRVPYYLQQGAGLSVITAPLVRVGRPPGSRYLEVGCGFGFALDFASRELGWRAQGIDPARIAALGRDMLGVAIELRYLGDDEPALKAACDVVMASETIEHVPSPIGFLRTLRNVLRPGGVLILTTPDAADLRPDTAAGALVGLLAPGWHLVFQNSHSLEALLLRAGFTDVVIEKDGFSLVAYASDRPFRLESDKTSLHATFVGYLARRAGDFPPDHDLTLGFAGRALLEAANDGDVEAGERSFRTLREACRQRFGIDLDTITEIPAGAGTASLEQLSRMMPLSLGCLIYADAMCRLAAGAPRPALEPRLLCAAAAADALRRALAELAQEDALSEEIAWTCRVEAALCAAVAGSPDIVERVRALPPFPGRDETGARSPVAERALVALANAGFHALAGEFADAFGFQDAPWSNPARGAGPISVTDMQLDVLFCLAIVDLQEPDTYGRAVRRFELVRRHVVRSGKADARRGLYWAAAQGEMQALERLGFPERVPALLATAEADMGTPADDVAATAARIAAAPRAPDRLVSLVNAGRYREAREVAEAVGSETFAEGPAAELADVDRDRLFSLAVLDVQPGGDPARAARRFALVRASVPAPSAAAPALYWSALRGEIEAASLTAGEAAAEALRTQVLQELGHIAGAIPDDLRVPRRGEEDPA